VIAVVTIDQIGAYPLGLRPKPCGRIVDTAVRPDAIDCDPTLSIKALVIRKTL